MLKSKAKAKPKKKEQKIEPPDCSFHHICSTLYSPEFEYCPKMEGMAGLGCKLMLDLKNGVLPDMAIVAVQQELKKASSIELNTSADVGKLDNVFCPRSLGAETPLKGSCTITRCPFYSPRVSFHCMHIHREVFFSHAEQMPMNVLEIGTNLDPRSLERMYDIGIYLSRMVVLMVKFKSEMTFGESKKRVRILSTGSKDLVVCPICEGVHGYYEEVCSCVKNSGLRGRRRLFAGRWQQVLLEASEKHQGLQTHRFCKEVYDQVGQGIYSLTFVRTNLGMLRLKDLTLIDVPFGYLFKAYHLSFRDTEERIAESFGLSYNLYQRAKRLFLLEGDKNENRGDLQVVGG